MNIIKRFYTNTQLNCAKVYNNTNCSLNISYFTEKKSLHYDYHNKIENGETLLQYFDDDTKCNIGHIKYRHHNGQICLFALDKPYRNQGLGRQILDKVISDVSKKDVKEIWVVASAGHYFWSNVYNKRFIYRNPPHNSVIGDGYVMKIRKPSNLHHLPFQTMPPLPLGYKSLHL